MKNIFHIHIAFISEPNFELIFTGEMLCSLYSFSRFLFTSKYSPLRPSIGEDVYCSSASDICTRSIHTIFWTFHRHLLFLFWNSGHIGNKSRIFYWIFILTLYYEFLYNRIFFRILYYEINNVTLRLITNIYEKVRLSKILFQSV